MLKAKARFCSWDWLSSSCTNVNKESLDSAQLPPCNSLLKCTCSKCQLLHLPPQPCPILLLDPKCYLATISLCISVPLLCVTLLAGIPTILGSGEDFLNKDVFYWAENLVWAVQSTCCMIKRDINRYKFGEAALQGLAQICVSVNPSHFHKWLLNKSIFHILKEALAEM